MDIEQIISSLHSIPFDNIKLTLYLLGNLALIALMAKLLLAVIRQSLRRNLKIKRIDKGSMYAIERISRYIIWTIAAALALETIGIKVTVLVAGSAALLVGVGLGLQQTFNDIISGLILLSERSIKVDDILEIDGDIVKIQEIGLRTSKCLNRDDISIIIPNSLITTNKVINWSHQAKKTRFHIYVGVAYGSDVELVEKLLKESALDHPDISDKETVNAQFVNFGNSSLDFQLLFFSEEVFRIERVKSDVRKIINKKFIEHNVTIPFPQIDVHIEK